MTLLALDAAHDGLIAAVIVAIISSVTTIWTTTRNGKKLETGNGKDIGPTVKDMSQDMHDMRKAIERMERRQEG